MSAVAEAKTTKMSAPSVDGTPSRTADVLVVEDRDSLRLMLCRTLRARDFEVVDANNVAEATRLLNTVRVCVVLTDLRLPGGSGFDVLHAAKDADANMPVIVMTAFGTIQDAVRAMKDGAFDFLAKPVDTDHLLLLVSRALDQRRLLMENLILKQEYSERYGFPEILGEDPALQEVSRSIQRAAGSDTTVLLLGESGTGKELFARALHHLSPRREGPFVAINCAAIPGELLENELFGHEKGAYTGAVGRKLGKLELASGGTVLLDEMGELHLELQAKLLRVLQERTFERVGGTRTLSVDVRIVAATNRDLRSSVESGDFREDLFYRLSVFPISIPALRERPADIPILVNHYVERLCRELNKRPLDVPAECMEALGSYEWPGNVRELMNCLERAVILCDGTSLEVEHLGLADSSDHASPSTLDLSGTLSDVSRRAATAAELAKIREALREAGGDRTQAATLLDVTGKTLLRKMRAFGLLEEAKE